jgi:hypothetical protein
MFSIKVFLGLSLRGRSTVTKSSLIILLILAIVLLAKSCFVLKLFETIQNYTRLSSGALRVRNHLGIACILMLLMHYTV